MTEPLVACVMLTADRPEMAKQAMRAFHAQTYTNKMLIVYDTGADELCLTPSVFEAYREGVQPQVSSIRVTKCRPSIGTMRNDAAGCAYAADIICHFDDDDLSMPTRISEQVALLQSTGADVVGYNDMLFWDTRNNAGEAWLYRNTDPRYALGTSLCYWRATWERVKFPDQNAGEDLRWLDQVKAAGMRISGIPSINDGEPRMIARIHGSNTGQYSESDMQRNVWQRRPEWDEPVRKIVEAS